MTDHAKRQEYLDAMNIGGMSNRKAVAMMFLGVFLPIILLGAISWLKLNTDTPTMFYASLK